MTNPWKEKFKDFVTCIQRSDTISLRSKKAVQDISITVSVSQSLCSPNMYKQYSAGLSDQKVSNKPFQTIVTSDWVKNCLSTIPDLKIVDGTFHLENSGRDAEAEYHEKHIPGAVYFNINKCADLSSEYDLPHMLPSPETFEEYVSARGISNDSHIVIYDNNPRFPIFSAQRVWWTFKVFGHDKISILEGGLKKWLEAGGQVVSEPTDVTKTNYKASFRKDMVKSYEEVVKNIESGEFQLVDARPPGRFLGTAPEPIENVKSGSIRNSMNMPFMPLMNLETSTYKTKSELLEHFAKCGVDLNKPVTFSCGSGLQATNLALSAFLCGKSDAAVYDGSWVEWYRRAPTELKQNLQAD